MSIGVPLSVDMTSVARVLGMIPLVAAAAVKTSLRAGTVMSCALGTTSRRLRLGP